jgi:hypothetical protein
MAVARRVVQLLLRHMWPTQPPYLGGIAGFNPDDGTLTEAVYFASNPWPSKSSKSHILPTSSRCGGNGSLWLTKRCDFDLIEPWHYSPPS